MDTFDDEDLFEEGSGSHVEGSGRDTTTQHTVIPRDFITDDEDYSDEGSGGVVEVDGDDEAVEEAMDEITEEDSKAREDFFATHEVKELTRPSLCCPARKIFTPNSTISAG